MNLRALFVLVALGSAVGTAALVAHPVQAEVFAAEELSRDFDSAHEMMLKGEAKSAAALYESLLQRGAVHPDVYFNLGNAYARSEAWVKAVVAYERALRMDPTASDVKSNLRAVRSRLDPKADGRLEEVRDHGLVDLIEPWLAPIAPRTAAVVLLVVHAFFVFGLVLLRAGHRRLGGGLAGVALVATLIAAAVTAGLYLMAQDPRAVVLEATFLRKGPDPRFERTTEVSAGARVRILDSRGSWHEVQKADGTAGWVPATGLERV